MELFSYPNVTTGKLLIQMTTEREVKTGNEHFERIPQVKMEIQELCARAKPSRVCLEKPKGHD